MCVGSEVQESIWAAVLCLFELVQSFCGELSQEPQARLRQLSLPQLELLAQAFRDSSG